MTKPPAKRKRAPTKKAAEVHPVPDAPQVSEFEQRVYAMPLEFIQCRDYMHSWRPLSARWMPSFNYFEQVLICGRCRTTKERKIGRRGQILESHYTYADDYQMPKGQGRMTGTDRDVLRLASVRAVLAPDTVQE